MGFWERSKKLLNRGVASTKEAIETATEKGKELGEKSAARIAVMQLEKLVEDRFAQIGRHVYQVLAKEGQQSITKGTEEIKELLQEVARIEKEIDEHEALY